MVGVFLLAAVVASFFGLARYRAGKVWQRILARNGVNLRHESNGVTYSQSSKGRTIFTLHASKAVPEGNGKYALHDAVLILYGRQPGRDDRIYGSEFEYDEEQGIARALGEVHMDLQAPEPGGKPPAAGARPDLSFGTRDAAAVDPAVVHVRTSGLVYMRKLGVAATGDPAEFRYHGITCTSKGAEFDTEHSRIRLLADVKLSGQMREAPFTLTASYAELDRTDETANLTSPVLVSGVRSARAMQATFHLHKDGTLDAAEANQGVELRSGTQSLAAPRLTATFGKENHPERAQLLDGVVAADSDIATPAHGSAHALDLGWDPDGRLHTVVATGAVSYAGTDRAKDGTTEERQMHGERAEAAFVPGPRRGAVLQHVRLIGGARLDAMRNPQKGAVKGLSGSSFRVDGDELLANFGVDAAGKATARDLQGNGHTRLEQSAPDGAHQQSAGDTLAITFMPRIGGTGGAQTQVSSAVQSGHVSVENRTPPKPGAGVTKEQLTTGHASKATFAAADGTLTLGGGGDERATVQQEGNQVTAAQIILYQGSGDADATGDVAITDAGSATTPATHVLASRARLLHAANITELFGAAMRPVQLWQGPSQVQADQITLDGTRHSFVARPGTDTGSVHAVFAANHVNKETPGHTGAKPPAKATETLGRAGGAGVTAASLPEAGRDTVEVSAARMDYDEVRHQAIFAGNVQLGGVVGEVFADRGAAFLKTAETTLGGKPPNANSPRPSGTASPLAGPNLSGSLDHLVLLGNVRLKQPGRTGFGEQLTYTAATDSFALTGTPGKPPHITGEQGSEVTGATLLFQGSESTIVVAGSHGDPRTPGPKRVHTETDLKE